ncbi:MAG TPA: hypothetical protein VN844_04545 [Pyrinomonadaceae bacterium]|nr:hypothetical protein [Pyrinomonadaceae bacterium]
MGVVDDAFKEATKSLDFKKAEDKVQAGYIRRRAEQLNKQKPSADALDLALDITKERHDISTFLGNKLLQILINDTDPKKPKHLDLATMSKVTVSSDSTKAALEKTYRTNRWDWMWHIVWRAMIVHSDVLWKPTATFRTLQTDALEEILDRRLRTVEQLHCNVNSGGVATSPMSPDRKWKVDGPGGPWKDGVLVRNFEYPFLPKDPFKDHLAKMTNWQDQGDTIFFNPPIDSTATIKQANIRFPKKVTKAWLVLVRAGSSFGWPTFQPNAGLKHDDVFRDMFDAPRENFFDRNWLYCDQTGSAVNIEALEFGMKRRPGAPHTKFETAMTTEKYVRLGPVVRTHREKNMGILMSDDADEFFENVFIDHNDLQIGDFVCFWNNHLYDLIAIGAWRNEYSHIMAIETDIDGRVTTTALGPNISLSGHGLITSTYSAMATDMIDHVKKILDQLRIALKAAVSAGATPPTTRNGQTLVQWSPYENFDSPGAWWIKIPKSIWEGEWIYQSLDDAVKSVPRTVAKEAGGTGYNAPPDPDAIYFPLFEPQVTSSNGDSWRAYLDKRKADASFRAPTKLKDLTVDGRLAQGLYYHGSTKTTIPVVRPKVRI